jgi:hypothetical protein
MTTRLSNFTYCKRLAKGYVSPPSLGPFLGISLGLWQGAQAEVVEKTIY